MLLVLHTYGLKSPSDINEALTQSNQFLDFFTLYTVNTAIVIWLKQIIVPICPKWALIRLHIGYVKVL